MNLRHFSLLLGFAALALPTGAQAPQTTAVTTAPLRDTEAEEASISNPSQECSQYDYPPVTALLPSYPAVWEIATLSFSGVTAYDLKLFAALNATIPNIPPRGTPSGDLTGVVYPADDPYCWWTESGCTTPKLPGLPADITQCDEPNVWGLTYDDGPNCSHNAFFDYLLSVNQKATLFYIGSNVMDNPLEAQRGLADQHELCAHTWSHNYMTSLSNEEAFAELYYSKKAIRDVVGVNVMCWRPPFGDTDDRIRYIANALGMKTIIWREDTNDWDYATISVAGVQQNYQDIYDKRANGTYSLGGPVVLSHEIDNETMTLAQQNLPLMQAAFDAVVPIAVCMNNTNPYGGSHSSSNIYPNFAQYVAGMHSVSLVAPSAVSSDVRIYFTSILTPLTWHPSTNSATATATAVGTAVATPARKIGGANSIELEVWHLFTLLLFNIVVFYL